MNRKTQMLLHVPVDVRDKFKEVCGQHGVSMTEIIISAMSQYNGSATNNEILKVEKQLLKLLKKRKGCQNDS